MKKITILLVIIFSFLFSTTSWGDWNYVIKTINGIKFYYDKSRVRKNGKYIYFWELSDFIKPLDRSWSSTKYVQLDCSIFRFKWLRIRGYENNMGEGEITRDYTPIDEWDYPPSKSTIGVMYNRICKEHK